MYDIWNENRMSKPRLRINARAIISAAKAMASGVAPEPVVQFRELACRSCPERWPGDETHIDALGWCSACNCGTRPGAALTRKIVLLGVSCPKGRWSANG